MIDWDRLHRTRRIGQVAAIDLQALMGVEDRTPPEWVRLVPAGEFDTTKGKFVADADSWVQIAQAREALGTDTHVDYQHQSTIRGHEAPAAGWVTETEVRDDGLWGFVRWTPRAAAALRDAEYRYLSPTLGSVDRDGQRHVVFLHSIALTNTPAILDQLELVPASQHEEPDMEELKAKLIALFKLDAAADDATIIAHAQSLTSLAEGVQLVGTALGVTVDGSDVTPLTQAARALKVRAEAVSVDELTELRAEVAEQKARRLVDEALAKGKLAPSMEEWALSNARKDPATFVAFLENAPAMVPLNDAKPQVDTTATTALSDDQRAVNAMFGVTDEAFNKHNAA